MKNQKMEKRWLSEKEAEHYTSLSRKTLDRRASEGAIHKHKVVGRVTFDKKELDLLMIRNKQVS
jgi:predicted DNA-binding transcriptional regulator AlpA